jgi:hypothetical protein
VACDGKLLERAIGVVYRPDTERWSHYFEADLPQQFDAVVHLDTTTALVPLDRPDADAGQAPAAAAETYRAASEPAAERLLNNRHGKARAAPRGKALPPAGTMAAVRGLCSRIRQRNRHADQLLFHPPRRQAEGLGEGIPDLARGDQVGRHRR